MEEARKATNRGRGWFAAAAAAALLVVLVPTLASAHVERASYWPNPAGENVDGVQAGGAVPQLKGLYSALRKKGPGATRIVCQGKIPKHGKKGKKGKGKGNGKKASAAAAGGSGAKKKLNRRLSHNKSLRLLNKSLKQARKSGYKLRPSQDAIKISKKKAKRLAAFNRRLLMHCGYHSIQEAVDASGNNDRIVIMPGTYTEDASRAKPTNDPVCAGLKETNDKGNTGAVSYRYQFSCPNDQNLIAVLGRSPNGAPPQPPLIDRHGIPDLGSCIRCNLQIQGSGVSPDDVIIDGGDPTLGDHGTGGTNTRPYAKDVGIRVDRADGFALSNVKVRHVNEHGIYVIETDGYLLDRFKAFYNNEYGVLTFVGDHGLMQDCEAAGSGDSGLYPGASADTGEQTTEASQRYSQEITRCDMHHNTAGYSGTDGNAVHVDHNEFYDNANGFTTDVFTAPGHPGFPQDSDLIEDNNFYSNNFNPYLKGSDVIPTVPMPVGTGMWIAGGNNNIVRNNHFYDNWRRGAMLFAVPDAFICMDAANQVPGCDPITPASTHTSYRNQYYGNKMGQDPKGASMPNGLDFWWDQGGVIISASNSANCWYNNTGKDGTNASVTGLPSPTGVPPDNLPSDCNNAPLPGSLHGQQTELLTCSTVPKGDPSCPWFTTPPKP